MYKYNYRKPLVYGILVIIVFLRIMCRYVGFERTKDFTKDAYNSSVMFGKYANIILIKGSEDGILVNVFGHAITFKLVGNILMFISPRIKAVKILGKGIYFFVNVIIVNVLNSVNNLIFK